MKIKFENIQKIPVYTHAQFSTKIIKLSPNTRK